MSWQTYVDDHLIASGFMYATILGAEGDKWASSPQFEIPVDEGKKLFDLLSGSSLDSIASGGFTIAGQRYAYTRGEVESDDGEEVVPYLQGRCKEDGKSAQGVIVMRTLSALIIGVHDPEYSGGSTFNKVNTDIGRVADYMIESGV